MEQGWGGGVGLCFGGGCDFGVFMCFRALFHSLHCKVEDMKYGAGKEAALTHLQVSWPRLVCGVSRCGLFAPEKLLDWLTLTHCPDCRQQFISKVLFQ